MQAEALGVLLPNINVLAVLVIVRVLVTEAVVIVVKLYLLRMSPIVFRFVPSPTGNMVCQI